VVFAEQVALIEVEPCAVGRRVLAGAPVARQLELAELVDVLAPTEN